MAHDPLRFGDNSVADLLRRTLAQIHSGRHEFSLTGSRNLDDRLDEMSSDRETVGLESWTEGDRVGMLCERGLAPTE